MGETVQRIYIFRTLHRMGETVQRSISSVPYTVWVKQYNDLYLPYPTQYG